MPYYNRAEREIGVSADVEDQAYLGIDFDRRLRVPDEGPAAVLPGQDGRQGRRRHDGRARRRAVRAEGPGVPAGPQRDPESGLRRRQGLRARSARSAPTRSRWAGAARATTTAFRSARSRPSTTPARRSPRRSRPDGSTCSPRRSPPRCMIDENGPGQRDRVQDLPRPELARSTPSAPCAGGSTSCARQRDRERAADARLGAAQHERADGPQPHGPRLPAELGAAARDRRHDARHDLHGRHHGPAERPLPPAPGRLQRRHPQRRLGLGGGLAVHRSARAGRLLEQVRVLAAHGAGRPDLSSAPARVHDRGAAEPEQPGHRRSGL